MASQKKNDLSDLHAKFCQWLDLHARKGSADVPARLVSIMALLERLREHPSLTASDHVAESGMQLREHNQYVAAALNRFEIESPVKELGRRSSNLNAWLHPLLGWLSGLAFESADGESREHILHAAESAAASRLQVINEGKPLIARIRIGTAVAVIIDLLDQAQEKRRAKDVAEYLVGAKMQQKFGVNAAIPKNVNTPNRNAPSDFRYKGAAIEVTVNPPDRRHLDQVNEILRDTGLDVWLLVRRKDRDKWQAVAETMIGANHLPRVSVADIETFVGQNMTEIGDFDGTGIGNALRELFSIYNDRWLPTAGSSGLRILIADPLD